MAKFEQAGFYELKDKLRKIKNLKINLIFFYLIFCNTHKTNGDHCMAELIVEDKPIELSRFSDLTVNCSDYAEFKCYVSDPTAEGKWYKVSSILLGPSLKLPNGKNYKRSSKNPQSKRSSFRSYIPERKISRF